MILRIAQSLGVTQQETFTDDDMSVDVHETARMCSEHQQQRRIVSDKHVHDIVMTHVVNFDQLFVGFRVDDALRFAGFLLVAVVVLAVRCGAVVHD